MNRKTSAPLVDELTNDVFDGLPSSARAVYCILRSDGPLTRSELAPAAGVHVNTLSSLMPELQKRGVIGQQGAPSGAPGNKQYYAKTPC